jgi:hypothetical protein
LRRFSIGERHRQELWKWLFSERGFPADWRARRSSNELTISQKPERTSRELELVKFEIKPIKTAQFTATAAAHATNDVE